MKYVVTLNGKNYEVEVTETDAIVTGITEVPVMVAAAPVAAAPAAPVAEAPAEAPAAPSAPAAPTASGTQVKAPMPGSILAVKTSVGQAVKAGDVLVVLEAMKMEIEVKAPKAGTVQSILVAQGDKVVNGTPLVTIG